MPVDFASHTRCCLYIIGCCACVNELVEYRRFLSAVVFCIECERMRKSNDDLMSLCIPLNLLFIGYTFVVIVQNRTELFVYTQKKKLESSEIHTMYCTNCISVCGFCLVSLSLFNVWFEEKIESNENLIQRNNRWNFSKNEKKKWSTNEISRVIKNVQWSKIVLQDVHYDSLERNFHISMSNV